MATPNGAWEQGYYAASFGDDECPYNPEANPDEYARWWAGWYAWPLFDEV